MDRIENYTKFTSEKALAIQDIWLHNYIYSRMDSKLKENKEGIKNLFIKALKGEVGMEQIEKIKKSFDSHLEIYSKGQLISVAIEAADKKIMSDALDELIKYAEEIEV